MEVLSVVLLLSGIAAFVGALFNLRRSQRLARALCTVEPARSAVNTDLPPVSILAPCRGVDDQFVAYARALLAQQYAAYEVLFLVESTTDPAWEVLNRILTDTPGTRAALIITGTAEGCSQKIHNLLVGLEHVAPETCILAFVDSDVQVHPHWLEALVARLDDPAVGATSGYRWYVPCGGSVAGSLRSAWNAATLILMAHPRYGFAWGGSTAIRREVFEKLRIRDAWSRGLSDDLLLTQAVRGAGLQIPFVAACLVPTFEPCTWRQLLEWTNRQTCIARVHVPYSLGLALLVHLSSITLSVLGVVALVTGQWAMRRVAPELLGDHGAWQSRGLSRGTPALIRPWVHRRPTRLGAGPVDPSRHPVGADQHLRVVHDQDDHLAWHLVYDARTAACGHAHRATCSSTTHVGLIRRDRS